MGALVSACGAAPGADSPALATASLPAAIDGRKTRVTFELPNGVTAILEENHVSPVVALQAWIAAGSCAEPAGQGGLAHLTERVVLGGAPRDHDAAAVTAWTSFDETVFETVVAAPLAAARLDALGGLLARATFDAAEVEQARADAGGELHRATASPAAVTTAALFAAAFPGHAYGRPVLGAEAGVKALGLADVVAFHARAYAGGNVTLVVVGDFDARAMSARVTSAFASLPKGDRAACPTPAPALEGPRAVAVATEAGEGRLDVGFRLGALDAEALAAADVLAAALAHGGAGRLPRELVLNRQLARAARASVFQGRDGGLLMLELPLVAGRSEDAARLALARGAAPRAICRRRSSRPRASPSRPTSRGARRRRPGTRAGSASSRRSRATPASASATSSASAALTPDRGAPARRARSCAPPRRARGGPAAGRASSAADRRRRRAARLRVVAATEAGEAPPRAAAGPAAVTAVGDVVRVVLPSGLRVLVLRDPTAAAVVVHAVWPGGLRLEDARSNGVTSLLAATLPRGTRTRDAARIASDLAALGGSLSASAGRDELGVTETFLARRWEDGLALLADCVQHPAFFEDEVERARRAALERVRAHEDEAEIAAARLYAATLWPGHAYRLPILGTAASLSGLTRRRLADHFQGHYGAANLTIAVVGDVDAARVVDKLRALFADAPAPLVAVAPAAPPLPRATDAPTEVFALAAKDQAHVVVGYPGLPLRDPERCAADVLVELLGGRENARDGRLAGDLAGVSLVGASSWSGVDGGALVFDLASSPGTIDDAVASLRAALAHVVEGTFPPAEVERAAPRS